MSENNNNNNNAGINSKDFLIGALIGGFVGAASALLLAPKSGKELRSDINEQASTVMDKGSEWTSIAKDKSSTIAKAVTEQSTQVAGKVKELSQSLRRDIDNWRNKGAEVLDESASAMSEMATEMKSEEELVKQK
ncbi:general stress protein [Fictibacillus macauensis ZFHKF-1]|uniref:General stress protein n=1 Tax=Fictibacillus macauensis ZFHKF-1 TaxID=1196324 RepID=I8AIF4_9BACL|nr:YtxH domain-containing protein [Fictibacillus macauensis]EIT85487.1 general stress protein [Fictibacillus macauensis ZFHKF-1]